METFPIVKRKDEDKYESFYSPIPFVRECCEKYRNPETGKKTTKYATKAVIMEIYARMKSAMETGIPYKTILDPPPADPLCTHNVE